MTKDNTFFLSSTGGDIYQFELDPANKLTSFSLSQGRSLNWKLVETVNIFQLFQLIFKSIGFLDRFFESLYRKLVSLIADVHPSKATCRK